jgi:acyl-CoA synthetase (NDP forming)
MRICGPNCFGIVNVRSGAASFSGVVPRTLIPGSVALVSQSGSLGNFVFSPLMRDRKLGFSHFISCGNQLGTTIEDYAEYLIEDPDVKIVAVILEALKNPRKLLDVARRAHAQRKSLIFCQVGKSKAGQLVIGSHTGALAGNSEILQAFLRKCGIMAADYYDEFVEAIELLAHVPLDENMGDEVVLVSGSGGGAAGATDHLDQAGMTLRALHPETKQRLRAVLPEFASATNPIDATGVVYDDPALLPTLFDAILSEPGRPIIATSVIAAPVDRMRRIASAIADTARTSGRTIVAYQPSSLGPVDDEIVRTLHAAGVPLLMGIANAMAALKHLPLRREYAARAIGDPGSNGSIEAGTPRANATPWDFLNARQVLVDSGISVVEAALASSAEEAVALWQRLAQPVALKTEAPGLLHKSDLGCVRLDCTTESAVIAGYVRPRNHFRPRRHLRGASGRDHNSDGAAVSG